MISFLMTFIIKETLKRKALNILMKKIYLMLFKAKGNSLPFLF